MAPTKMLVNGIDLVELFMDKNEPIMRDDVVTAQLWMRKWQIQENDLSIFTRYDDDFTYAPAEDELIKVIVKGHGGPGGINDKPRSTTGGDIIFGDNLIVAHGGEGGHEDYIGEGGTAEVDPSMLMGRTIVGENGQYSGGSLPAGKGGGEDGGAGATDTQSAGGDGLNGCGGGGGAGGTNTGDASCGGGEGGWGEGYIFIPAGTSHDVVFGEEGVPSVYNYPGGKGGRGFVMIAKLHTL